MIAEGLSVSLVAWCLSALALGFGAYLGVRGLLDPHWAQKLVRLQPDAQGGGFAEFRAVYGGVFLGLHLVALLFVMSWIFIGKAGMGSTAIGATAVIAASWFGAAFGRVLSMLRDDGTRTQFNRFSVGIELVMFALIGAPWLLWFCGVDG
ncbi:MAG: hypothetical protein QM759_06025 [Terricaulis sp.]